MPSFRVWLGAARPRTLPLSISGIIVGAALALKSDAFEWSIFLLALLATLGFQILSNYANDYGDGIKGTDNIDRVGPARAMQSGLLTALHLKKAIIITSIITMIIVVILIYVAFGKDNFLLSLLFLILGLTAIISAIKYTVGKTAYGYRGMGDLFVFIFFGLIGVAGCYFLFKQELSFSQILPAITIGALSAMVLHLNNMRDREADKKVGKNTMAVILGKKMAVRYHTALFVISLSSWGAYLFTSLHTSLEYMSLLAFVPMTLHLIKVYKTKSHPELDPELKKVALSTFLLAILFFMSCYL